MTKSKYTDRFWYFRNQADEDDDDGTGDSLLIPVCNITGFLTTSSNQRMTIYFEGMNKGNVHYNDGAEDGVDGGNGYVVLNITAGKAKEVMQALVQVVNRGPHHDGVTVIADDSTTDADGTTRSPVYIHKDILSVQHIENSVDGAA
jgi:hypothetical protein